MKQLHFYIYLITNLLNEKTYIGKKRIYGDKNPMEDNYFGSGWHIKNSIKKYGKENFKKEILEDNISTDENASTREIFWISYYRSIGKAEYNIAPGGSIQAWNKGLKMEDILGKKYIERLSNSHKGIRKTELWKQRISESNKGRPGVFLGKKRPEHSKKLTGGGNGRAKQVYCIELEKEFNCIKDAVSFIQERVCSGNQMKISACCQSKKETAFGYHWKFV
jgi:hypothetical protein